MSITATVEMRTAAAARSEPNATPYPVIPLTSRQSAASASQANASVNVRRYPRLPHYVIVCDEQNKW
jgi:hypothetical protein